MTAWTPENNTTPWRDLTSEQQAALKERGPWEYRGVDDDIWSYRETFPHFFDPLIYRRKPTPAAAPEAPALTKSADPEDLRIRFSNDGCSVLIPVDEASVRAIVAEMLAARELAPAAEPEPIPAPTKPSVDWSQIAEPFNWIARDEDGLAYAMTERPEAFTSSWSGGDYRRIDDLIQSYRPGSCNWRDSLICRPGEESKE